MFGHIHKHRTGRTRAQSSGPGRGSEAVDARGTGLFARIAPFFLGAGVVLGAAVVLLPRTKGFPPVVPEFAGTLNPEMTAVIEAHVAAVQEAPHSAPAHGRLAGVYEANKLWREARRSYRNARLLDANEPTWAYHEALAAQRSGDPGGALELLRKAAGRFPEDATIQHHYGDALLESGDLPGAESAFRHTIDLSPDRPEGYAGLGEAQLRMGEPAEAAASLERAVRLDPQFANAHYLLASAYQALGRSDKAQRHLRLSLMTRSRYQEDVCAKRYIEDEWSRRLRPYTKNISVRLARSTHLIDQGRFDEALSILEPMLAHHPDNVKVLNKTALAYLMQDRVEAAYPLLERARRRDETNADVLLNLAIGHLKTGRVDEAETAITKAIEYAPDMWWAHYTHGLVMLERELWEAALSSFRRAVTHHPTQPIVYLKLAEVCLKLEEIDDARRHLEVLIERWPRFGPAYALLADVHVRRGALHEARRSLELSQRLSQGDPKATTPEKKIRRSNSD